jgi:nucleoside phosphorylase
MIHLEDFGSVISDNYVVVLTSNSVEKAAVNEVMEVKRDAYIGILTGGCYLGLIAGRFILHISGESGISSNLSIGRIFTAALQSGRLPKPSLIILAGFCWGDPEKTNIGDMIFSTDVLGINGRIEGFGGTSYKEIPNKSVLYDVDSLASVLSSITSSRVVSGQLLSSETLFADDNARDTLLKRYTGAIGGEIKSFGIAPSCKTIPWAVFKAVSDHAGTEFNRARQRDAAIKCASFLPELIAQLMVCGQLAPPVTGQQVLALADVIYGDIINIRIKSIGRSLNEYLDKVIGPHVSFKLKAYCSETEYEEDFSAYLCDTILEISQNAIRHGQAESVRISFQNSRVVIEDDGDHFDVRNLSGNNGGARAFSYFREKYIYPDGVNLEVVALERDSFRNQYSFILSRVDNSLRKAARDCRAVICSEVIDALYGRRQILKFDEKCQIIYVDLTDVRMTSTALKIADEVAAILSAGRKAYVVCGNESQADMYREILAKYNGISVRIVLASP